MTRIIVDKLGFLEESLIVIPSIISRMDKAPFIEPSEEVRIQFLALLQLCLEKDATQFLPYVSDVSQMLSVILTDPNPEMKINAARFAEKLSTLLKDKVGGHLKKSVVSLTDNLKHQHSKVRNASLNGLKYVCVAKDAEEFLSEAIPQLKMTANDRSQDVRMNVITITEYWLQNMDYHSLKTFEKDLMLILLNGISEDQKLDISEKSQSVLETHGRHL